MTAAVTETPVIYHLKRSPLCLYQWAETLVSDLFGAKCFEQDAK